MTVKATPQLSPEIRRFLKTSGLKYVSDGKGWFARHKKGKGFEYHDRHGQPVRDEKTLARIRHIGIPPAYTDVWICPQANGHIQAVGYDARGRKQYRYHEKWRQLRDEAKFEHILVFGKKLPALRRRVARDLGKRGLSHDKVIAAIVNLLEKTLIRVGNDEYAKTNKSYGLTTLRSKHVDIHGADITFAFQGKSAKQWRLKIHDPRIARIMRYCDALPGHELFKYVGADGKIHTISSSHVNAYIREATGEHFTAKDFRTWYGTILAAMALAEFEKYDSAAQAKKNLLEAVERVARRLGNTRAICRKCYIHPEILDAYLSGDFLTGVSSHIEDQLTHHYRNLTPDEVMVLAFLQKRLKKSRKLR